jgi:hypothetical protein
VFGGNLPPPGWAIANGALAEIRSVVGYMQRDCQVRGNCSLRECRRSVFLEWPDLVRRGQALLQVQEVQDAFRCSRIGRCAITWIEEPTRKVTLGDLAGRDHIAVQLRCIGPKCGSAHVTTVATMIARLRAQGAGGPETDAMRLSDSIPSPCSKCGGRFWRTEILWHNPDDPKSPSWLEDVTRRRDEAKFRRAAEPTPALAAAIASRPPPRSARR